MNRYQFGLWIMAAGAVCMAPVTSNAQVVVYSNDFSTSAGPEWSNNSIAVSNGEHFLATNANGFGNGTVSLTLFSLAPHSSITINFDLYIIQSWDGNGPNGGGVDNWALRADMVNRVFTNFANFTGGNTQAYPANVAPLGPGANNPPRTGAFDNGHLGFGTGDFGDATYRFSLTFPHSNSIVGFDFISFQNQPPGDEGWGLDNVSVSITPVPEPSSMALAFVGALGVRTVIRRRKSKASLS